MADINKTLQEVSVKHKKILSDLEGYMEACEKLSSEINDRFRDEYSKTGSISGLEDFYALNNIMKKNTMNLKNACVLVKRMRDMSGYNISEEQLEEKQLEKIFDK
jgi:hypothetical protein